MDSQGGAYDEKVRIISIGLWGNKLQICETQVFCKLAHPQSTLLLQKPEPSRAISRATHIYTYCQNIY